MKAALMPALALILLAASAHAEDIYKCTADGKVTYSQVPCPAGASSAVLAIPAAPTPDPAAAAELQRQKKQADALEKARHKREAAEDRVAEQAARTASIHRKKCARLALDKKWADEEAQNASTQTAVRARQKAAHAADTLALECPK